MLNVQRIDNTTQPPRDLGWLRAIAVRVQLDADGQAVALVWDLSGQPPIVYALTDWTLNVSEAPSL